jgi:hypothetical protein
VKWWRPSTRTCSCAFVGHFLTVGPHAPDRLVEAKAIEQADGVHHQSRWSELILLSLPDLAALAVEDLAGELVALLVSAELDEYYPAVSIVVHVGEQREALGYTAHLCNLRSDGRGPRAACRVRTNSEAVTVPTFMEPATRNSSSQSYVSMEMTA